MRVLCARVGTANARSAAFDVDVVFDLARVERTLPSVAFDACLDADLASYRPGQLAKESHVPSNLDRYKKDLESLVDRGEILHNAMQAPNGVRT